MPTPQKAISNATEFTAIHTRATGAVAAKYLISRQPVAPDIIGARRQAGALVETMNAALGVEETRIWSRTKTGSEKTSGKDRRTRGMMGCYLSLGG